MKCPHCGEEHYVGYVYEYPYPYKRRDKDGNLIQHIDKYVCEVCKGIFYFESRLGTDMGLDKKCYEQIYKYGLYQFRYTGGIK